jgi:hypothetical protein
MRAIFRGSAIFRPEPALRQSPDPTLDSDVVRCRPDDALSHSEDLVELPLSPIAEHARAQLSWGD